MRKVLCLMLYDNGKIATENLPSTIWYSQHVKSWLTGYDNMRPKLPELESTQGLVRERRPKFEGLWLQRDSDFFCQIQVGITGFLLFFSPVVFCFSKKSNAIHLGLHRFLLQEHHVNVLQTNGGCWTSQVGKCSEPLGILPFRDACLHVHLFFFNKISG